MEILGSWHALFEGSHTVQQQIKPKEKMKTSFPSFTSLRTLALPLALAALSLCMSMRATAQAPDAASPPPETPASGSPPAPTTAPPTQGYAASGVKRAFGFMDSHHEAQLGRAEAVGFKKGVE
ncbi:MAG: hypothetical protein V4454_07625 [Pseudomonadota bacterium]